MLGTIIKKYFDGIVLSGSFLDAEGAMDFLKKNHVDLVISDIRLPGLSGFDLAQLCQKDYPMISIIFISAYKDFEIARKAINSNVIDYIIKPITFDNINAAINKAYNLNNHKNVSKTFLDTAVMSDRQTAFANMTLPEGKYMNSSILEFFNDLSVPFTFKQHEIIIIRVSVNDFLEYVSNTWKHAVENFYNIISNIINENSSENLYGIVVSTNKGIIDLLFLTKGNDFSFVCNKMNSIIGFTAKTLKFEYTSQILLQCKMENLDLFRDKYNSENILYYIFNSDLLTADIQPLIKKYFTTFSSLNAFAQKLYLKAINLFGVDFDITMSASKSYGTLFDDISDIIDTVTEYNKQKNKSVMSKIESYVAKNYMNNISMSEAAEYVHLSSTYFSRFFKNNTGVTFMHYLNKYRIKKSLEILHTTQNVKLSNVGFSVGYDSVSAFYRNFKIFTGVSPSEYIKQIEG